MAKQDPAIRRQKKKAWRAAHSEELRAYSAKYYLEHLEEIKAREFIRSHSPEHRAYSNARYKKHRDSILISAKKCRIKRRKKIQAYVRANADKYRQYCLRRRARKNGAAINDLTAAQWSEIKAAYGHRCVYCGRKMKNLTQDHLTPLSQGGNHTVHNVVPACASCNKKKHTNLPPVSVQPLLLTIEPPLLSKGT